MPPLKLSLRLMELSRDRQVIANKKSSARLIDVLAKSGSLFKSFFAKKAAAKNPINTFIGAADIAIENGINTIAQ
jgi:hypothetical protein